MSYEWLKAILMSLPRCVIGVVAVSTIAICGVRLALAEAVTGAAPTDEPLPPQIGAPWQGRGIYDLKRAGIRIRLGPNQRILDLTNGGRSLYDHLPCRRTTQAVIFDPDIGLMLVGRERSGHPIVNSWDEISLSVVPLFISSNEKFAKATDGFRLPIVDSDWIAQPTYDAAKYVSTWSIEYASGDKIWSLSQWLKFDRDGYISVSLISRLSGSGPELRARLAAKELPVKIENLEPHDTPLAESEKADDYTAAFLMVMDEPLKMRCAWETPFGPGF
jgi:hypothetical protein